MDAIVVGIDVSKDRLNVHVHPAGESFAVSRNAKRADALIARIGPLKAQAIAVEVTGGFEAVVAASLAGAGLRVIVINPAQVRAFAKALGKRAKTDPIDAAGITRFVAATKPEIRALPGANTRLLAALVTRRRQIILMMVVERQREPHLPSRHLKKSLARLLKTLEKELNALEQDIDDAVRGSPAWRERKTFLKLSAAAETSSPEHSWRNCLNSASSIAGRLQAFPALLLGQGNRANGAARALPAVDVPRYVQHCS